MTRYSGLSPDSSVFSRSIHRSRRTCADRFVQPDGSQQHSKPDNEYGHLGELTYPLLTRNMTLMTDVHLIPCGATHTIVQSSVVKRGKEELRSL
ncbi:hypothetical protein RRG08_017211 [Elysia crispata]|uniref:Uncharacterized protein n=1 Tax=Elysia crispata TaxID=231223 RepID=A0AAE1DM85_9GAST|nr:hypothetical protein RRG08_017211 [Elysia crispata]